MEGLVKVLIMIIGFVFGFWLFTYTNKQSAQKERDLSPIPVKPTKKD